MEPRETSHHQEVSRTFSEEILSPALNTLRGVRRWGFAVGASVGLTVLITACGSDAPRVPTAIPTSEKDNITPTTIVIETPTTTPAADFPTAIPVPSETVLPLPSPSPSPRPERAPATPTLTTEAKEQQRKQDVHEMREMFSTYVQVAPNRSQVIEELNRIYGLNPDESKPNFINVHTTYTNGRLGSFVQLILLNPSLRASRNQSEDVLHIIKDLDPTGKVKTKIMKYWAGATGVQKVPNSTERSDACISSPLECTLGTEVLSQFTKQNDSYVRSQDDKEIIIRQVGDKILVIERYDRNAAISPGWL